ncbi:MAG: type IV secretory pathway protein, partial [Candidatus Bathyarchaeia archaeon]
SIHADSAVAVINRLESEPMNIPRSLILTLNVIAMQSRVRVANRTARRVSHIVELIGMDPVSKEIIMNDVYKWDPKTDRFLYSGRSILIERLMEKYGITEDKVKLELERRRTVLEWMVKLGIRRYDAVGKVIREYYMDPERVYEKAKLGLSA